MKKNKIRLDKLLALTAFIFVGPLIFAWLWIRVIIAAIGVVLLGKT